MARYYFHVRDEHGTVRDEEGTELPGIEDARFEARMSARDLIIQNIAAGKEANGRTIDIANEKDEVLETVSLRDVMFENSETAPRG
ncbi:MAG TPA: hypothetical protein VGH02_00540 [Rhizomicrobium sp.]